MGGVYLKMTTSHPKESARHAQKIAILRKGEKYPPRCHSFCRVLQSVAWVQKRATYENVFPNRRGVLRTTTANNMWVCVSLDDVGTHTRT